MKKFLFSLMLMISAVSFAQINEGNRFHNENTAVEAGQPFSETARPKGPGNPADPAPISDYIPVLVGVSLALAVYAAQRNTAKA
ncbi:hypothetical protein IMZ16_09060 [Cruoricaptor ignavus]|uniref:Uncharacterized protein n=1 Tax=Cruoricaptor ignavus TaxID=1118202 RepID=A0A7M1T1F9_9FLAO|nr:hypothetical protein [Cruoricaptor ignavus]QOR73649.1 hypothetical protein IMZ16_09060 [Cruoricaptor ignavus]